MSRLLVSQSTASAGVAIRSYSAAAAAVSSITSGQPQFDYDLYLSNHHHQFDEEEEEEKNSANRVVAVADEEGSRWRRGVQWVFIGNPSAKKHVYAGLLSKLLDVPHISISTLVRQELSPSSLLYKQIASAINQGKIVPESIIFGLLSNRLEEGYDRGETGFILDGIPRTRLQAEILDQFADIDLVVNFKCCEGRILGDRTCSDACKSRHATSNFSTTGSNLSLEGSKRKVSAFYSEQKKLLEDYYRSQKKLIDFEVGSALGDTWKGLLSVLHLQHVDAHHIYRALGKEFPKP